MGLPLVPFKLPLFAEVSVNDLSSFFFRFLLLNIKITLPTLLNPLTTNASSGSDTYWYMLWNMIKLVFKKLVKMQC